MRIALMNDSFPPILDGVANAVVNYAQVLTKLGHEVMVAVPDYPDVEDHYAFPVVRYASLNTTRLLGYRAGYPFSPAAMRQLTDFQPDIIHSHCPVASTLLARTLREAVNVPVVFTYHTKFDIDIRTALRGELLQNSLISVLVKNVEACDEVWTVSEGAGENLRQMGYQGAYRVMENGVDLPRGRASEQAVAALRAQLRLSAEAPIFLFTGRLRWYKGIRLIVEGLSQAMRAGEDFRMVFVGEGSDGEEIMRLCEQRGLMERCVFAGPIHDRELLRAYYSMADLFLFPSTFDTNGIVVREAAACALPALLVAGSCAAEGVVDHDTGLLMPETAEGLCRQVRYACAHREDLRRLGKNAQERLYISWEMAVRRAVERYQEILDQSPLAPIRTRWDMFPLVNDVVESVIRLRELQQLIRDRLK